MCSQGGGAGSTYHYPYTSAVAPGQPFRYTRKIFSNHRCISNNVYTNIYLLSTAMICGGAGVRLRTVVLEKDLGNRT